MEYEMYIYILNWQIKTVGENFYRYQTRRRQRNEGGGSARPSGRGEGIELVNRKRHNGPGWLWRRVIKWVPHSHTVAWATCVCLYRCLSVILIHTIYCVSTVESSSVELRTRWNVPQCTNMDYCSSRESSTPSSPWWTHIHTTLSVSECLCITLWLLGPEPRFQNIPG